MQLTSSYKDIWKVGYPIMIGNMAHGITQAVDTAFMAQVGKNDLNATLLAGMSFFFLTIIAIGFTRGTQILVARRTGEGNYKAVGQVFDQLFLQGLLLTVLIFGALLFFKDFALPLMIRSDEILLRSDEYLDVRQWGTPVVVLNLLLLAFYTGIGKTKVITISTVVLSMVNILLDYLLIFGHLGLPEMGIRGAAMATVLAETAGTLVLLGALVYRKDIARFHLFRFPTIDWGIYRKMQELSLPIVFQHVLGMGAWYVFFLMVEKIGEDELAVSSVIKSLYMLIGIPLWGLGSAINTVVSNLLGQKKVEEVIPAALRTLHISMGITLCVVIPIACFPKFFIGLYSQEILAISSAVPTLYVVLATLILFSFGVVTMHAIMGIGNTRLLLLIEAIAVCSYFIYAYCSVFVWHLALPKVWLSEFFYWTWIPLLTSLYLWKGNWKKIGLSY